ncbi:hypothetical protein CANCADRAFT_4124 [Tortispora caseinolytica NRRL Y-17796]|uniref:GID complex catalytic subunit 2 n=1 Tax=Tortispora caseinolytica NRRL Y-17796 TaxID=767744 RepID=A0A1E4TCN7_9ASCO|nr:hypothetical protein CANCADRAFT_4124 [Tortispora caseinolytica NRRL Y-17796]
MDESLKDPINIDPCIEVVDDLLGKLKTIRQNIYSAQNAAQAKTEGIAQLQTAIDDYTRSVASAQKAVYTGLSKAAKSVERTFKVDLSKAYDPSVFEGKLPDIDKAVALHLIRQGDFDTAKILCKEAHISIPKSTVDSFKRMYLIVNDIRQHKVDSAVEWATANREKLQQLYSRLEFELHAMQFVNLLSQPSRPDGSEPALDYARKNFPRFAADCMPEISKLTGAFMYRSRLNSSPYHDLFTSEKTWDNLEQLFIKDFCSIMSLTPLSPLYVAASAGSLALPDFVKMSTISSQKHAEWTSLNEIPVEIDLPKDYVFHNIFVCPVSKEQTTARNPPMLLPCGHVVAKESLASLSHNNSRHRFKCPYCPNECMSVQCVRIYFEPEDNENTEEMDSPMED